nr:hypothetical protein GCM10017745_51140 [Saccharothrix mutabilis subsp. capreolus]
MAEVGDLVEGRYRLVERVGAGAMGVVSQRGQHRLPPRRRAGQAVQQHYGGSVRRSVHQHVDVPAVQAHDPLALSLRGRRPHGDRVHREQDHQPSDDRQREPPPSSPTLRLAHGSSTGSVRPTLPPTGRRGFGESPLVESGCATT